MDTNAHESEITLAQTAGIWSAETCLRFGRLADLSAKPSRVQRPERASRVRHFDGDKSPAKSADQSAHSKFPGCDSAALSYSCPFVVNFYSA